MVFLANDSNSSVARLDESRDIGVFDTDDNSASFFMIPSSTTLVTFGCAAAIALALVGAAYAVDRTEAPVQAIPKGDAIAIAGAMSENQLVLEDVNIDAGISNLVIIRSEPSQP